jgi:ATP-dependent HslUV protease ATP-binding subunit HslU
MLREGALADREIELQVADNAGMQMPMMDVPGMPGGQMGMINLNDMLSKAFGGRTKPRKMKVGESHAILLQEEADRLVDNERVVKEAKQAVEQNGIVFIDEIDKICARGERAGGADVSREGVQRDLLPLIEGTTVSTKHGPVKTDHILFVASGAFHVAKPSDLRPVMQGRLPIRVELKGLDAKDLERILTETKFNMLAQQQALLLAEGVRLEFEPEAVVEIARLAAEVNRSVENIGARRLHTILERLLEEVSFAATDQPGTSLRVDAGYVRAKVGDLAKNADLSKFIL